MRMWKQHDDTDHGQSRIVEMVNYEDEDEDKDEDNQGSDIPDILLTKAALFLSEDDIQIDNIVNFRLQNSGDSNGNYLQLSQVDDTDVDDEQISQLSAEINYDKEDSKQGTDMIDGDDEAMILSTPNFNVNDNTVKSDSEGSDNGQNPQNSKNSKQTSSLLYKQN